MRKIFGILTALVLAFGISTASFASPNLAKPSLKTKATITKTKNRKSLKPKRHHHRSKRKKRKVIKPMTKTTTTTTKTTTKQKP
ncbi:hypothetical protein BH10ACI1_BH10ACI1_11630 [soil metagenome]